MQKLRDTLRTSLLYVAMAIVVSSYPMTALAESTPESSGDAGGETSVPAPTQPANPYVYNSQTGRWDSDKWQYDPGSGQYRGPRSAPPVNISIPETTSTETSSDNPVSTQDHTSVSSASDEKTDVRVDNDLNSNTQSGNAAVERNTKAGAATSGNAKADATILNVVHSSVQGDTAGVAHFVSDIYGNVSGDITLAPAISSSSSLYGDQTRSSVQSSDTAQLNNTISLSATSGNADVVKNGEAGNATTGNATTVVNLVNLINSIIAANKSFIGTINIHGNLDGDILISPDFIPQLLASNATNVVAPSVNSEDTSSQSIINNIKLNAQSGSAMVDHNTEAGDSTSGTAATNLTVLNLTGRQVVAKNSLLVFVNVLGVWVGIIVDAPVGATAAAIGSGVSENTDNSGGSQIAKSTSSSSITNNIDLSAVSGDANVAGNTKAGNATTGNASASANVLNMATSSFSISDWFGILFINVFGSWYGSFGVNTSSGELMPIDGMALPQLDPGTVTPTLQLGFVPQASPHNNLEQSVAFVAQQYEKGDIDLDTISVGSAVDDPGNGNTASMLFIPSVTPVRGLFPSMATTAVGFVIMMLGVGMEVIRRRHGAGMLA